MDVLERDGEATWCLSKAARGNALSCTLDGSPQTIRPHREVARQASQGTTAKAPTSAPSRRCSATGSGKEFPP